MLALAYPMACVAKSPTCLILSFCKSKSYLPLGFAYLASLCYRHPNVEVKDEKSEQKTQPPISLETWWFLRLSEFPCLFISVLPKRKRWTVGWHWSAGSCIFIDWKQAVSSLLSERTSLLSLMPGRRSTWMQMQQSSKHASPVVEAGMSEMMPSWDDLPILKKEMKNKAVQWAQ